MVPLCKNWIKFGIISKYGNKFDKIKLFLVKFDGYLQAKDRRPK